MTWQGMKPMIYLTREKNDLTGNETHDLPHTREERPDREWNPWFTSQERRTTWQGMKSMIYLTREKNDLTGNETHDLPHTREERPDREWNPWSISNEMRRSVLLHIIIRNWNECQSKTFIKCISF
jgi:hypothetical protein